MKIGNLKLKCGECPIIDYCNEYEDTPPCLQSRFEKVDADQYLNAVEIADFSKAENKNDMVDAIYVAIKEGEPE